MCCWRVFLSFLKFSSPSTLTNSFNWQEYTTLDPGLDGRCMIKACNTRNITRVRSEDNKIFFYYFHLSCFCFLEFKSQELLFLGQIVFFKRKDRRFMLKP